jgi:hypothetical protein
MYHHNEQLVQHSLRYGVIANVLASIHCANSIRVSIAWIGALWSSESFVVLAIVCRRAVQTHIFFRRFGTRDSHSEFEVVSTSTSVVQIFVASLDVKQRCVFCGGLLCTWAVGVAMRGRCLAW